MPLLMKHSNRLGLLSNNTLIYKIITLDWKLMKPDRILLILLSTSCIFYLVPDVQNWTCGKYDRTKNDPKEKIPFLMSMVSPQQV